MVNYFRKKSSIVDVRLGSKNASGGGYSKAYLGCYQAYLMELSVNIVIG